MYPRTMWITLLATAHAAWTETARVNDCTFSKGPPEGGVQPVHVECHWPVAPDKLHALLADGNRHAAIFDGITSTHQVGTEAGGELFYQVHQASGMSDREIVVRLTDEAIPDGRRYAWTKATDQSALTHELVEIELNTGMWEVTGEGAGSKIVYELRYAAGGSVPGFLVRWFQGSGVQALVGELRAMAEKQ
jgi:hypothetical protein